VIGESVAHYRIVATALVDALAVADEKERSARTDRPF